MVFVIYLYIQIYMHIYVCVYIYYIYIYIYIWWRDLVTNSCTTLVIPWTVACQASLSWDSPGKNTGVGCHFLLQGIFLTQESNLGLLHCKQIVYQLSYEGSIYMCVCVCVCVCAYISFFRFFSHVGHYRVFSRFPCVTVGPCQLSILYIVLCMCQSQPHYLYFPPIPPSNSKFVFYICNSDL